MRKIIKKKYNQAKPEKERKAYEGLRYYCKSRDGKTTYYYDDRFLYAERGEEKHRLDIFDKHYYKLRLINGYPILEIDGLRMQLVRDFETPLDYAKEVIGGLGLGSKKHEGARILDTCMGLGYTAIEAAKKEAVGKVITCEIAEAAIKLAKWNPESQDLFFNGKLKNSKIEVLNVNVAEEIKNFKDAEFDFVIHDPPRYSHADELYSLIFYKELFRVVKNGSRLFHYFGSVGKNRKRNIKNEVLEKLTEAGFSKFDFNEKLQGVYFSKI